MTARPKLFRWQAIVPLSLLLLLLAVGAWLFLDTIVERGIEDSATFLVGAQVDLASADVRIGDGSVTLRGLQVTNPDAPMTNLVQADEIVVNIRMEPLLERKLHVDTVGIRGVRFGTPRETSGALENPPAGAGRIRREIDAWADRMRIPPLSLEGLGQAINVDAVDPDSLRTVAQAQLARAQADSMRESWTARLVALDPRPRIDSAGALVERLQAADPARLGVTGVTQLAADARGTLQDVQRLQAQITSLDSAARNGLAVVTAQLDAVADAQAADVRYALGTLRLPSLEGPQLSPAIFGDAALDWIQPVLYWIRLAEEYLPPGLDPRRYAGPKRTRASGTTVVFPDRDAAPRLVLGHADADLAIGGEGVAAGSYRARVTGLSSAPALYGRPMTLEVGRGDAVRGPRDVRAFAMLDHVSTPIRDSLDVVVSGFALPSLELDALGARLLLGEGTTALRLRRAGDRIEARWSWRTPAASWEPLQGAPPTAEGAAIGSRAWAEALLWDAVSGIRDVGIEVRIGGTIQQPSLGVSSNVGDAVARSLQRVVGREVERAEREVRERVNALVQAEVDRAEVAVAALQTTVADRIGAPLAELGDVQALIENEIRRLTGRLPGGLRIPGDR
ncbi:MAG: hypothetical protein AMS20_09110 [Gemmatimonas sp. SG8_28]|nr:MAG: hypothetical protein AMS20_09110 [Gemmatimonas sp. SG8_28]